MSQHWKSLKIIVPISGCTKCSSGRTGQKKRSPKSKPELNPIQHRTSKSAFVIRGMWAISMALKRLNTSEWPLMKKKWWFGNGWLRRIGRLSSLCQRSWICTTTIRKRANATIWISSFTPKIGYSRSRISVNYKVSLNAGIRMPVPKRVLKVSLKPSLYSLSSSLIEPVAQPPSMYAKAMSALS